MSSLDPKSISSEVFGRVTDPIGGPPDLVRFFNAYNEYFCRSDEYSFHVEHLVAEYSRGDDVDALRGAFALAIQKIQLYRSEREMRHGHEVLVFPDGTEFAEIYRNAFVLLAIGLCLSAPSGHIETLAANVTRGDVLLELLIASAAPGTEVVGETSAFQKQYGELYACIGASPADRPGLIHSFVDKWYAVAMNGFDFKDMHLQPDPLHYVGYWCFEAAGVVAALGIDDSEFRDHPHYPEDLLRMYRDGRA